LNLEKNVIIMGDFNLETPKDELSISPQYNDIWKELHPNDVGYTFVIEDFKRRFDRVLLKNE
jgi:endonuclease/exonuclease/phosphatase family metal-dependent hydrolase